MKNPLEAINKIPKEILEILAFIAFVLAGAIFKMIKLKDRGLKITVTRCIVEVFMSFFIAGVVYAGLNQFCHFNMLFVGAICALSGSVSSTLFHSKIEELLIALFDGVKDKTNQYLKVKKND